MLGIRKSSFDRNRRERVDSRAELPQRPEELVRCGLVEERCRLDDDERPAAERLRDVRDRRELQEATDRRHFVRHVLDPVAPSVQHFLGTLDREEEHARVHFRDRIELNSVR